MPLFVCLTLSPLFLLLFISLCDGFGGSPPLSPIVCATLTPFGHWGYGSEESEALDFQITTSKDWFQPNDTISSK